MQRLESFTADLHDSNILFRASSTDPEYRAEEHTARVEAILSEILPRLPQGSMAPVQRPEPKSVFAENRDTSCTGRTQGS